MAKTTELSEFFWRKKDPLSKLKKKAKTSATAKAVYDYMSIRSQLLGSIERLYSILSDLLKYGSLDRDEYREVEKIYGTVDRVLLPQMRKLDKIMKGLVDLDLEEW
jgi:hypothetical protein